MPPITFPPDLPVSARRAEIEAALQAHQVIIVCGETGSGKTTQLPKIALNLGRAAQAQQAGGRRKLIGHTQPRRIAASSVASRIAEELQTPLGELVGYKVRFHDRISPSTAIKLMTDGILLAETQTDPLLKAYDTLIIDEAHERSLNIDFLLGYLRQILPKRPDLKVIVTSATIDAERFAQHFKDAKSGQPAPVLMVSGRMFPVEQRYRPFEDSRDYGLNEAIADAVDELWAGGKSGDILVFLPGEREIRECTETLRKHHMRLPGVKPEVLALYDGLDERWNRRAGELNRRLQAAGVPVQVANLSTVWSVFYTRPSRYNWMFQFYLRAEGLALSWVGTGRLIFSLNFGDTDFERVCQRFVEAGRAMAADGWWWQAPGQTDKTIRRSILREMLARRSAP